MVLYIIIIIIISPIKLMDSTSTCRYATKNFNIYQCNISPRYDLAYDINHIVISL